MRGLRVGKSIFDFDKKIVLMGILNVTPDSFSDGGLYLSKENAIKHAKLMERHGADIIDIGGESTRPGSTAISEQEEIKRVLPIIKNLSNELSTPLSIDTSKAVVAEQALNAGAGMVNDTTALEGDPSLVSVIKDFDVPVCLMHMRETPKTMQNNPSYTNIIEEVKTFLSNRAQYAMDHGISDSKIVIDPGIGFGKRTGSGIEDNCEILAKLSKFKELSYPLLIGASRKTFLGNICGQDQQLPPDDRLEGSLAAACIAAMQGADIIRVHDVKETRRCLTLIDCIKQYL